VKRVLIFSIVTFLLVIGVAYAHNFNAVTKAGEVTVNVLVDNEFLKVGNNNVTIELADVKGKAIIDADVALYYFMPSMPAMNYEVQASSDGTKYVAVIKPVMPGAWDLDIKVKRSGGDVQKATISFDAK
jgi:nitrogen fixation protein FixH